ncbi:MAG: EF-hand domain-containing protein [Formosimonas sp.]
MKYNPIHAAIIGLTLISSHTMAASFSDADKNNDGALTIEELKAASMDDLVSKFQTLDTDKDGKISKAEAKANR